MNKNPHDVFPVPQHVVRCTANDNAGAFVRNHVDGLLLGKNCLADGAGAEVQLPHNGVLIGVDAGNKLLGQTAFLGFVIVSQMFAPVVLLIGIYQVMQRLGLTDNILGLIFINAAFNQAFTIWLLRGTFMGISAEMEQAATIDGCTRVQSMMKVLLPVAAPGIVTTLIFIFINAWNEYTVALCLISTDTLKPLTVGINTFNGYNMIEWQYLFAASIFAIIPVVILFMCIEKNLVSGLASGGVKG